MALKLFRLWAMSEGCRGTVEIQICNKCGSNSLMRESAYATCEYCRTKFLLGADEAPLSGSEICLNSDIQDLLSKAREEPAREVYFANLVLDIDHGNEQALAILRRGKI
jgi:hypothetical protein